ncbi:FadR/GntR family transcriptional regulator [Micromonospora sp. HM5-17]|jgi:DNA-binding FadR family transcriptional regulator|uniref:FadR/GntR family transcriptional regulator n=1 Tax=Micromonospora sp. HM5-17 TaxID=2487710 RepID=UPI000F4894CF|nr:FCD domain-containing protein [Micromonospora sp. HM5-17]ROT33078.1 FadR family transcriptional regulator [Micromonospora sp. HM5-17]
MTLSSSEDASARLGIESGLHARLLDQLGTAVCGGQLAPGSVLYIDDLVERYAVSRSVVREVLRVLASMGLVESRRRVGTLIRSADDWNVFDPQVIRWRLASSGRIAQLRSITELRAAVEPQAASLAAARATPEQASDLVGLAAKMWAAGKAGDEAEFLRLDIEFHRQVLVGSGNEMFVKLHELVAEVLAGRYHYDLMPHYPHEAALQLHADVAQAIQHRDGEGARRAMVKIMEQAMTEMSAIWAQSGSGADS